MFARLALLVLACLTAACTRSQPPEETRDYAGFNFTGRSFGIDQGFDSASVSRNADGRFVIAWTETDIEQHDDAPAPAFTYAYLRLYSAQGEPLTDKIRVQDAAGTPYSVDAAIADDGSVIATWAVRGDASGVNDFSPIYARSYDAQGHPLGAVTYIAQVEDFNVAIPVAAARPGGGFAVAWQNYTINEGMEYIGDRLILRRDSAVSARFLARDAMPQGEVKTLVQLPTTLAGGPPERPSLAFAPDGSFVAAWQTATMIYNIINLQRFTADGAAIGSPHRVPPFGAAVSDSSSLSMDGTGGFVLAWYGDSFNLQDQGVRFQRYSPAAEPLGPITLLPGGTNPKDYGVGVCGGADGRYVITWYGDEFVPGGDTVFPHYEPKKFGQRYTATGEPVGGAFRMERDLDSYQSDASITRDTACDAAGGFVSIWGNRREVPTPIGGYYLYEGWASLYPAQDAP